LRKVDIYDSTLRDGAQAEGISFSVEDKLRITRALSDLGVRYIEAGNPASNPKDLDFFGRVRRGGKGGAVVVAFGSTRRKGATAAEDKNTAPLVKAGTDAVCIVGKCWDRQVSGILRASLEENIDMIEETVGYFASLGKEVIFDAEHFFDGCKSDTDYPMLCLRAACRAGAAVLSLCDTNGGCFPEEISGLTAKVIKNFDLPVAIHCHNDCGLAVANSIAAVAAGAAQVQGTLTGFGERCGNANLSTVIGNLELKKGISCLANGGIAGLTTACRLISEIANVNPNEREPYTGKSAFAHKGGMHVDGAFKYPGSFEHIDPELVGNRRKFIMSEVAGRSAVIAHIQKIDPSVLRDSPETERIIGKLKELEHFGYQFEAAESTFELVIRKQLGKYKPLFELVNLKIIAEQPYQEGQSASALIKIIVDGKTEITAAEGDGPVNAMDKALRKALCVFYPHLDTMHLTDYKVRVMDGNEATASKVRVLIESADGAESWTTVGVSADIIEASRLALADSIEYKLIKDGAYK